MTIEELRCPILRFYEEIEGAGFNDEAQCQKCSSGLCWEDEEIDVLETSDRYEAFLEAITDRIEELQTLNCAITLMAKGDSL